jgi:methyltransferase NSUN6
LQRGTGVTADTTSGDKNDPLRRIKGFPAGSIDHILLDPPCSALGLRPKLDVSHLTKTDLDAFVRYQQHFLRTAVTLLKVHGYMTYSTCTIHMAENEGMVRWLLDTFADRIVLVDVDIPLGRPGRPASPLTDTERQMVRYFCPTDRELDTMGFFVAKFQKIMR